MVELEYENTKIAVPESWADVPLGLWDQLFHIRPVTSRERVDYIAKLCRMDTDVLLSWPADAFNRIVEYTRFVFGDNPYSPAAEVTINGTRYVVATDDGLTLGEWIDADTVQKGGDAVLSGVLAVVCRPAGEAYDYRNNDERQKMFAAAPTSELLPVLGFFLQRSQQLRQLTKMYSSLAEAADRLPTSTGIFRSLGAGIKWWRIWPITRYLILTALLRWRLRKHSTLCGTNATAPTHSTNSAN